MCIVDKMCSCRQTVPEVFVDTYTFSDVVVTAKLRGERCTVCREGWSTSGEGMATELAAAKVTMALGTRDPKAFTFCRKAIGIGIKQVAERFGTTAEAVALYKEQDVIPPEWWTTLAHLVANADGEEPGMAPLPPLPPCRGSYISR